MDRIASTHKTFLWLCLMLISISFWCLTKFSLSKIGVYFLPKFKVYGCSRSSSGFSWVTSHWWLIWMLVSYNESLGLIIKCFSSLLAENWWAGGQQPVSFVCLIVSPDPELALGSFTLWWKGNRKSWKEVRWSKNGNTFWLFIDLQWFQL